MATSEPSTSAPVPSQHVFLYEIPKHKVGAKVRFLCCVRDYDVESGNLLVEHAYPSNSLQVPTAYVDANLVRETAKTELFATGAWLNVVGYVRKGSESKPKSRRSSSTKYQQAAIPLVQAVLMWDAGPIRASEYEGTMEEDKVSLKGASDVLQKYQ